MAAIAHLNATGPLPDPSLDAGVVRRSAWPGLGQGDDGEAVGINGAVVDCAIQVGGTSSGRETVALALRLTA